MSNGLLSLKTAVSVCPGMCVLFSFPRAVILHEQSLPWTEKERGRTYPLTSVPEKNGASHFLEREHGHFGCHDFTLKKVLLGDHDLVRHSKKMCFRALCEYGPEKSTPFGLHDLVQEQEDMCLSFGTQDVGGYVSSTNMLAPRSKFQIRHTRPLLKITSLGI